MKIFMLSLLTIFIYIRALAEPVAGILEKTSEKPDSSVFITLNSTSEKYQIISTTGDATEGLKRLTTGDFITGNGTLNTVKKTLQLESLDYVGLKKLLGLWYSGDEVMNFSSFSNLSIYPIYASGATSSSTTSAIGVKADFRYSTAPLAGNQWAVFLSSREATVFATIEFNSGMPNEANSDFATLRTYNVETGSADHTIRLIRWGN